MKKKEKRHYIDKNKFTNAVIEYTNQYKEYLNDIEGKPPLVSNYIGQCFIDLTTGLAKSPNFCRYSYKNEMIYDAVENCLKAINNYNPTVATVSGKPNAFGYFNQIAYFAFLRRIKKEDKEYQLKLKLIKESGIETFINVNDPNSNQVMQYIDGLKNISSQNQKDDDDINKKTNVKRTNWVIKNRKYKKNEK